MGESIPLVCWAGFQDRITHTNDILLLLYNILYKPTNFKPYNNDFAICFVIILQNFFPINQIITVFF